ncbi:HNH endonuclease signature motif containing protein [Cellulomonas edaphi]|uniref:DUF222 domain-containing protein n=1 Tax=Cellulomonas edaphi TaxID=3053468 RepID=A0ABT7S5K2_9CELL|nr:HNH endonuclease signature motif containing protein [Cellulomons edaphi]MDM7830856.1 DUF222 domain-containing protein [Cellulomons edaphi]
MFESSSTAPDLPRAMVEDFDAIRATLGRVSAALDSGIDWSGPARREVLAQLARIAGVTATTKSRWLRAEREAGTTMRPGDPSFEAAHSRSSRSGLGAASREVRQADALGSMPDLAAAVDDGEVPLGHVEPIARALATASPDVEALLRSPGVQRRLVDLGRRLDAPTFARKVAGIVAEFSPGQLQRDHDAQRRARYLRLTDSPDGTRISGLLDRISGHTLRLALEATGNRPGPDREPEQARADALVDVARAALDSPTTSPGAAVRPHVSLILREETLAGLRRYEREAADRRSARGEATEDREGHARREGHEGGDNDQEHGKHQDRERCDSRVTPMGDGGLAASLDAADGFPAATLEDGTVVPASETVRILCDCEITRVALSADGLPLDLGRTKRRYTGAHRRAVIARDGGCAWPGCERQVRWTEIHHIRWWDRDGGSTSLDNAAALCSFHHHVVHARDLTLERVPVRIRGVDGGARGGPPPPASPPQYILRDSLGRVVAEPGAPRDRGTEPEARSA